MMLPAVPNQLNADMRVPYPGMLSGMGYAGLGYAGLGDAASSSTGGLPFGLFANGITNYQAYTWKEWAVIAGAAWFFFGRRRR
jgi:hypothetical protein